MRSATKEMQYLFDYHKHTMDFVTDSILGECKHKETTSLQDGEDGNKLRCLDCGEEE